jgi:hypothetical protein
VNACGTRGFEHLRPSSTRVGCVFGMSVKYRSKVLISGLESNITAIALVTSAIIMNSAQAIKAHSFDARILSSGRKLNG